MTKKTLKHYWTVLSKSVVVDKITNNMVLGETIEEIRFQIPDQQKEKFLKTIKENGFVALPFEFCLSSYMEIDKADVDRLLKVEVEMPNGELMNSENVSIHFGPNKRGRHVHKFPGIRYVRSGKYLFRLVGSNGKSKNILAELPLSVTVDFN